MRTWISRRLRPLLAVSAVAGLAWAGWSQRDAVSSFDWSIDHGLLALAVALFAVAPLLQGLTFALGLRRIGAGGSGSAPARVWARSFLLRYEPSGVVGFAYRVTARERVGASTAQVVTVTGYEQLAVGRGGGGGGGRAGRRRRRRPPPPARGGGFPPPPRPRPGRPSPRARPSSAGGC